jgi:hypothetical protein
METKDKINDFLSKINYLKESIEEKKNFVIKMTDIMETIHIRVNNSKAKLEGFLAILDENGVEAHSEKKDEINRLVNESRVKLATINEKLAQCQVKEKNVKDSIEKEEKELAMTIGEYQDYLKEVFKSKETSKEIDAISFGWFSTNFCRFSEEQGEYITEYNRDDVLTFFGKNKDGEIIHLFDFKISNMIKENGYCNYNYKDFILDRITTNHELDNSEIYYTTDIDEFITKIQFN